MFICVSISFSLVTFQLCLNLHCLYVFVYRVKMCGLNGFVFSAQRHVCVCVCDWWYYLCTHRKPLHKYPFIYTYNQQQNALKAISFHRVVWLEFGSFSGCHCLIADLLFILRAHSRSIHTLSPHSISPLSSPHKSVRVHVHYTHMLIFYTLTSIPFP